MLTIDSLHRRLPILVNPCGDFYTPTFPEDYGEGNAMGDLLSGTTRYHFQRLVIREKSLLRRNKWKANRELLQFDHFPAGWQILEGRPYITPDSITPEQARKETNVKV